MAEQERNPWLPENVQGGYQQGLNVDFAFNAPAAEDTGFLDGLMYNPLAVQNNQGLVLGPDAYAQLGTEDFKPLAGLTRGGLPGTSNWIRGGDRMQYETSGGHEGSGNLTFLHQQEFQPSRGEASPSGATGAGPADSENRSQENEVSAARKEMKSNREKLLRDRMNDHFAELAGVLDPSRPPKNDKASILNDSVCVVKKLRDEIAKLQSEHSVLLDESKELTLEKNELKEERQQVKNEKEALERRLQGMLSWMNFNPSLMVAAMANSAQAPPSDPTAGNPPNQSGPAHPPAETTPAVEADPRRRNEQDGVAKGFRHEREARSLDAAGAARVASTGAFEGAGSRQQGLGLVANQGANRGANQGLNSGRFVEERGAPIGGQAQHGSQKQGSQRAGSNLQQPTRPLPVYQAVPQMHLRPSVKQSGPQQPAGGLRNLQPAPERAVRSHPTVGMLPEQARQRANPAPPERHIAPRQQPRKFDTQPGGVVHRPQAPPSQNPSGAPGLPTAGQSQPGASIGVAENARKARVQVQGIQQHMAGAAQARPMQPVGSGHVAAPGHTNTAHRVEKRKGQVSAETRVEPPAEKPHERPPTAEQTAPIPTPHPFPAAFPHIPYMGAFPGMMGMHTYPYPPQVPSPTTAATPETAQQPPTAPFPYHAYPYGQPGYPYPVFPHAHPMAYPGFGYAHPYAAPGMSPFGMPQGAQPAQADSPRPASVERPSAKLAQVQTPEGDGVESAQGGLDGDAVCEAVPEETAGFAGFRNEAAEEPVGFDTSDRGEDGCVDGGNVHPEPADSQAAKRARVEPSNYEAECPPENCIEPHELAGPVMDYAEGIEEVERLQSVAASPNRALEMDGSSLPESQSSPLLMGSQPSNCSSSSSGSHYGELWTQSFQSALGLPEHDPTIRPPAA